MADRIQENNTSILSYFTKNQKGGTRDIYFQSREYPSISLNIDIPSPSTKQYKFSTIPEINESITPSHDYEQLEPATFIDNNLLSYNDGLRSIDPLSGIRPSKKAFDIEILKKSNLCDAAWFCDLFKPYLGRFTLKLPMRTGQEARWYTANYRLNNNHLQDIIRNGKQIGWYSSARCSGLPELSKMMDLIYVSILL